MNLHFLRGKRSWRVEPILGESGNDYIDRQV